MPEHPDVATFRELFDYTSLHRQIGASRCDDERVVEGVSRQKIQQLLKGSAFERSEQHGKYLFAELSGKDAWIAFHFGMTGHFAFLEPSDELPDYAHFVVEFEDNRRLAFVCPRKLGYLTLVESPAALVREKNLGPDALQVEWADFLQRLEGRSGALKSLLMDQSVVAGIGNVYSDEILFQCGWHPAHPVSELKENERRRLYRTMRRVLRVAAHHHARPEELPPRYLLPQRKEGGRCPHCGGRIAKTRVGRTAYFCPSCQE